MFGERANRVLGSVGNRSRFFTAATLFLLSSFAASVWADNSTGSIGECAFFGRPGGILSTPGGGKTTSSFPILHFAHVSFSYISYIWKFHSPRFLPLFHPSLRTLDLKKSFPVNVSLSSLIRKIAVKFLLALIEKSLFIEYPFVFYFLVHLSFSRVKSYASFVAFDQKYKSKSKNKISKDEKKKIRDETKFGNLENCSSLSQVVTLCIIFYIPFPYDRRAVKCKTWGYDVVRSHDEMCWQMCRYS